VSIVEFNCPECRKGLKLDIEDPPPGRYRVTAIVLGILSACLVVWCLIATVVSANRGRTIKSLDKQVLVLTQHEEEAQSGRDAGLTTPPVTTSRRGHGVPSRTLLDGSGDRGRPSLQREVAETVRDAVKDMQRREYSYDSIRDANSRLDPIEARARSEQKRTNRRPSEQGYSLATRKEAARRTLIQRGYSEREAQLTVESMVEMDLLPDPPRR